MAYNPTSGQLLYKTVVPNAALQTGSAVASHYNLISKNGTVFDAGASQTNLNFPSNIDDFLFNCNQYDVIKVTWQASALTGIVGGQLALFDLLPGVPTLPLPANLVQSYNMVYSYAVGASLNVFSTTFSPHIAQTQSSGSVAISTAITVGGRLGQCVFGFFASTLPTAGNQLYINVQGF